MTVPSEVTVIETETPEREGSYVDWPAIIAGVVLASAISILLLTFGSAIGLSFSDFNAPDGANPMWIAIAAATWLIWVQVSSFMAGGYITGRMRRRHHDATDDEVDVRDGAHGLLVWSGALVLGAILAVSGVGAVANAVGAAAGTLTTAAASAAGPAADAVDDANPNAYFVDMLFRPAPMDGTATTDEATDAETPATDTTPATTTTTPTATPTTPATTTTAATPAAAPAEPVSATARDPELVRSEATRIFAQAATGDVAEADRTYLAQLVADQTALTEEEADARVDDVIASIDAARTEAAEVAEEARKTGIIGAFIVAASFLVSAIGAFWAAQKGGHHRDKNTAFPGVFRRF